ncbi:MAG TPA: TonB-dependent receptor [Caulobacteraceae bacterium]|jgi:iron complex outermembrane receptor protein|nr:TonB-dependent receptor [Caulobacteraceae bacterium]
MKRALLRGASAATLIVVGGFWASQASAQAAPAAAPPPAAPPAASDTGPAGSGQVIVTAQRRAQAIEHVPVAVTAFTAKQRDLMGIQTVQQLSDFTPGLSYYSIADRAYIRGIGRNTDNLATESGVATYYNGIYYGANASIAEAHDSLFVSQVEVNRGPQNTLHGSNADGGTINYVSQRPTHDFYAEGRVGVEDYGEYYGEGVVSGPITDHLRFRLGGNYTTESGGYFKNLDGRPEGGNLPQGNNGNTEYLEGQLDANIGDHLDAWAMASSGDYRTSFHTVSTVGNYNDYEFPNAALAPGAFYGLCGLPGHAGDAGCAGNQDSLPFNVVTDRVVASSFPGNNPTNVNIRHFIETSQQSNDQRNDIALATHWTYHFPIADLQYIGGYQQFNYDLNFGPGIDAGVTQYQVAGAASPAAAAGCTGAGVPLAVCEAPLTINPAGNHTSFVENEQYFSNELNLSSTTPGPLQWILGLYWYHQHFDQPVGLGCEPFQTQLSHPLGAPVNPGGCVISLDGNLQYDSYAGYGQFTWQIDPQWKFEGAIRYTEDHKWGDESFRAVGFDFGELGLPTAGAFGAATPGIDLSSGFAAAGGGFTVKYPGAGLAFVNPTTGRVIRNLNASWNAPTGEANLTWQPDSDTLAYAKYSRGYKTGGFNAGSIAVDPETAPEFVDAFELGLKKTFAANFQLNAAAFYYDYYGDQQPLNTPIGGSGATTLEIVNIKAARTYGVELEAVWRPIDPLVITAEYSYLSSKVTSTGGVCYENTNDQLAILPGANKSGCPVAGFGSPQLENLVGKTLPEAPPNKIALNALYTLSFDPGKLVLSASYIWKDKTYGVIFNTPEDLAPAYSTVNLRAEWDDAKNRYTASFFVDNLFNTNGWDNFAETQVAPNTAFGVPYDVVTAKGLTNPLFFGGELQFRFH